MTAEDSVRSILSGPRSGLFRASIAATMLLISLALTALAQSGTDQLGTGGRNMVQGRLYFPSGRRADARIKVRLESVTSGSIIVFADDNGSFTFRSLIPGTYTIVVDETDDFEGVRESIYIEGERSGQTRGLSGSVPRVITVPIYLRPKQPDGGQKGGTVNALLAGVPKPALDLYNEGLESARAGKTERAIEKLQGALALYPDFPLALNELGVQYIKLGRPEKAVEALKKAVKIMPDASVLRLNYGRALLEKKEYGESERELREAVARADSSAAAHLYLGIALLRLKNLVEAEKELLRAIGLSAEEAAIAHYYLGGIYWGKHEYSRAADELETYLKLVPQAPDAERIKATIQDLRSKR